MVKPVYKPTVDPVPKSGIQSGIQQKKRVTQNRKPFKKGSDDDDSATKPPPRQRQRTASSSYCCSCSRFGTCAARNDQWRPKCECQRKKINCICCVPGHKCKNQPFNNKNKCARDADLKTSKTPISITKARNAPDLKRSYADVLRSRKTKPLKISNNSEAFKSLKKALNSTKPTPTKKPSDKPTTESSPPNPSDSTTTPPAPPASSANQTTTNDSSSNRFSILQEDDDVVEDYEDESSVETVFSDSFPSKTNPTEDDHNEKGENNEIPSEPTDRTFVVFNPDQESIDDLATQHLSHAEKLLKNVYGDSVHTNDGTHLHGGIDDDITWQKYWLHIVSYNHPLYDAPPGPIGKRFISKLADLWQDVIDRKCNSEIPILFPTIIWRLKFDIIKSSDIKR